MKFNLLEIRSKRQEAAESVELTFNVPEDLKETYKFQAGQYITIATEIKGKMERRAYSICTDPYQNQLKILVKKIPNGSVSSYINDTLKVGEKLLVVQPNGSFKINISDLSDGNHLVLIGAGSGITPLISIIQSVLKSSKEITCHLIYGSRTTDSIIFKEKFERLSLVFKDQLKIHHFISDIKINPLDHNTNHTKYYNGMINTESLNAITDIIPRNEIHGFYLCGPGKLIENSIKDIKAKGYNSNKIHQEYFVAPDTDETLDIKFEELKERTVNVTLEGKEITTFINDEKDILRQLMADGYEPPYSCLQGTCSTCKAKLVSGEVKMKVDIGLEADEKEAGYILTCQSIPITEKVVCKY